MGRTLSVARLRVAPDRQEEYLELVREMAEMSARRGRHLWVFRSRTEPDIFLEFNESPSLMSHRNVASRTPEELRLEQRLLRVANYQPDAGELWEAVELGARKEE